MIFAELHITFSFNDGKKSAMRTIIGKTGKG